MQINIPDFAHRMKAIMGITYAEKFGKEGAFITKCTSQLMRDLGSIQAPQNAFILNLGLESLHVRMPRHVENDSCRRISGEKSRGWLVSIIRDFPSAQIL